MKTNFTQALIVRIILFILLCLYSFLVFGQPDVFENGTLKSGTTLQPGAATGSNLREFNGIAAEEKTSLHFSLIISNNVSTVILEKSHTMNIFQACAEFWINFDGNKETNFQFSDKTSNEGSVYYRLKIIDADGKVQHSNILHFARLQKN